ncbi:complement C1q-like protein 4 [Mercenaria mercenaria]|uniref:complement C1q-like protein 4 n=1 Tax=Mercenaria mercenaria TaxID=6596 RepID=UPI00234F7EF8|nr:complement C1q-like protein 4 [Mercenaria mercenaria]
MATFLFGILLISFLGYTRCENCVSESRFNELEEIIRVKFQELQNENYELKEKLLALETKLEYYERHRKETPVDKDIGDETDTPEDEGVTNIRNRINGGIESKTIPGKLKRQVSTNVAFYAYLSGKRCYGNHETFIYDVVETNVGNGYNSRDGIFDVPVTGVYVFTVTLVQYPNENIQAEVIVDGVVKGFIFVDYQQNHEIDQASTSIVVHVNAGNHVFIRRGTNSACYVASETNYARTTFGGWLLF